jgi:hypothetical protein
VDELELLAAVAYDEGVVTEVIRPAAVLPEAAARAVLVELALRDVLGDGCWQAEPTIWRRYDRSFDGGAQGAAALLGTMQIAYGTPTRYEITIFRATITREGASRGWTVASLCDDALSYGGLSLSTCPRAELAAPPKPFRFPGG